MTETTEGEPCRRVQQWWAHPHQQDWRLTHRNAWAACARLGRSWQRVRP